MSKPYHEIYRGFDIDYELEHDGVYITKDGGNRLATVGGVEAAYDWIDKEKRRQTKIENM
jgi:hypothetical protein